MKVAAKCGNVAHSLRRPENDDTPFVFFLGRDGTIWHRALVVYKVQRIGQLIADPVAN